MRPRLLFLNRSYYPDSEATGQLLTELCEHLATQFDVTVVPGQPNHNPRNATFRRWGAEQYRGVNIQRVWNSRLPKHLLPGRAINLLSYLSLAALTTFHLRHRPDVVIVETDPPLLCLLGAVLRQRYGCSFVVYLQDLYPDLAIGLGKLRDSWLSRSIRRMFLRTYRLADRIVVLSDDMRQVLIEAGVDGKKIIKIPNWTDCKKVHPIKENNIFRTRHGLSASRADVTESFDHQVLAAHSSDSTANLHSQFEEGEVGRQVNLSPRSHECSSPCVSCTEDPVRQFHRENSSANPSTLPHELAALNIRETKIRDRQVIEGSDRVTALHSENLETPDFSQDESTHSSSRRSFVVMYSGNIGLCQGLENVLAAAELLTQRLDIVFLMIGDGAKRHELQHMATSRNLANVRFLDYQPADELAQSLSAADVHLVPLDPRVSSYLMPSKLYGALASGTPVIAIAPSDCELSQLVEREEVGYVVEPNRPTELAALIESLADHPGHLSSLGKRARQLAEQQFDRAISVNRFSALIEELIS